MAYQIITDLRQEKLFDRNIFELSSGEMQIVKLGRAIIQKPKVILFDLVFVVLNFYNYKVVYLIILIQIFMFLIIIYQNYL